MKMSLFRWARKASKSFENFDIQIISYSSSYGKTYSFNFMVYDSDIDKNFRKILKQLAFHTKTQYNKNNSIHRSNL